MSGEELKFVHEAFESNWIAPLGPQVEAFEQEIASYVGTKGALALIGYCGYSPRLTLLELVPGIRCFAPV